MISVCLCTLDRFDLTQQCVLPTLANIGHEFELLCVDNGSTDKRVHQLIADLHPVYHRMNSGNEGYARMMNQLLLRAKGDYLCLLDNDMLLSEGWGARLVECNTAIPESGLTSIHCVMDLPPVTTLRGIPVHVREAVFGVKFFRRAVLEKVGFLNEAFHPYGNEDVEYNHRTRRAGLVNYYVTGVGAQHNGLDVGEQTPYRQMKWKSLETASVVLAESVARLEATGIYYLPPPELTNA